MNKREEKNIQLAEGFLCQLSQHKPVDEAIIDANFLFRLEYGWCEWVRKIRQMIWAVMGKSDDSPFSSKDGARILIHLDSNPGVTVGVEFTSDNRQFTMATATGNYRCFDQELREEYNASIEDNDTAKIDDLYMQIWAEANQTSKIQGELKRLAYAYRLIPSTEAEAAKYPLTTIQRQFQSVVTWVLWEEVVPSFLWSKTILLESPTDEPIKRTVRPHEWSDYDSTTTTPKLRLETRIRTWSVYILTRRGGGTRTEQSAVDLWNKEFSDTLDLRNYRSERDRLFEHGGKKRVN